MRSRFHTSAAREEELLQVTDAAEAETQRDVREHDEFSAFDEAESGSDAGPTAWKDSSYASWGG